MGVTSWPPFYVRCPFQSPGIPGITAIGGSPASYPNVSIPFRGFHGDNEEHEGGGVVVHVSIPFRGFHGDNVLICVIFTVVAGFNPLSGIPWG